MIRLFALALLLVFLPVVNAQAQERMVPQHEAAIQLSFAPLVKQVSPAVVNIYTKRVVTRNLSPFAGDPFFERFFGGSFGFGGLSRGQIENSLGSGVIVDPEGLVVTNAHVIKGASEITVVLPDGREYEAEKALVDERSDLALLRVDPEGRSLPSVEMKPSEDLEVGDLILAIGNPFGVGQTVTSGIVSALARSSLHINDFNFFIQTDAAVNPGNSGGPLVAMDGRVVGINTAIFSRTGGSLGIGFAIPSEMVATVIAAAEAGRSGEDGVVRPWLGMQAQSVSADIAASLDLETPRGVLVTHLHESSPAKKAGMETGDLVLSLNGRDIRSVAELKYRMATIPLGQTAEFGILDDGRQRNIRVEAMGPPEVPPRDETELTGDHILSGAMAANINPAVSVELGLPEEEGVVISALSPRSRASRVVQPGDVIISINGDDIEDIGDLERELRQGARRGSWNLVISRGGQKRQLVVR